MFALAVLAVVADFAATGLLGFPAPVFSLLVLAVRLVLRRREVRVAGIGTPPGPTTRPGPLAREAG